MITRDLLHPNVQIEENNQVFDYSQLISIIKRWHSALDALELKAGDLYYCDDMISVESVMLFIAAAERGLVFCSIMGAHPLLGGEVLDPKDVGIAAVFTSSKSSNRLSAGKAEFGFPTFAIEQVHDYPESDYEGYKELNPDTDLMVSFSSGTTGTPKNFTHTHKTVAISAHFYAKRIFSPTDRFYLFYSINHTAILSLLVLPTLIAGSYCMYQRELGRSLLKKILEKRPNKMALMRTSLADHFQNNPLWSECRLDFIDLVLTGGSVLQREGMAELLLNKGVKKLSSLYGTSETNILSILEVTKENVAECFSKENYPAFGELVPHFQMKLNEEGVLFVKSEAIAKGLSYLDEEGYFCAGDVCFVEDGKTYFRGRRDRIGQCQGKVINHTALDHSIKVLPIQDTFPIRDVFTFVLDEKLYMAVDIANETVFDFAYIRDFMLNFLGPEYELSGYIRTAPEVKEHGIKPTWDIAQALKTQPILTA